MTQPTQPILFGIPNCDTVKRARAWLTDHGVDYQFHDYKKLGVPEDRLDGWIDALTWEKLVNRKGTAWRKLDPALQDGVVDAKTAKKVMIEQPSVVKRPVVDWGDGRLTVGFDPDTWEKHVNG